MPLAVGLLLVALANFGGGMRSSSYEPYTESGYSDGGGTSDDDGSWQMGVDGTGYSVTCMDGTTSLSGGRQGACSHHGGVR